MDPAEDRYFEKAGTTGALSKLEIEKRTAQTRT